MAHLQHTIKKLLKISGIGLHSGKNVSIALHPADAGVGIVFENKVGSVQGTYTNVSNTTYCTTLTSKESNMSISTVEHLMAALSAANISNVRIQVNGPEIPISDGSAKEFLHAIRTVGIQPLNEPNPYIRILRPVKIVEGNKSAALLPFDENINTFPTLKISVGVDFKNILGGIRFFSFHLQGNEFDEQVASARTFTFKEELTKLKEMGLIKGGSLDNAVVFDNGVPLNPGGLRFSDEWVRHKALDCCGDLALASAPLHGEYVGVRPGHSMTNKLLFKLFEDKKNYTYVTPLV